MTAVSAPDRDRGGDGPQEAPAEVRDRLARVLAGLDGLSERPLSEQVALLDAAHTGLREALDVSHPSPRPTS